jgi:hypothetical protein
LVIAKDIGPVVEREVRLSPQWAAIDPDHNRSLRVRYQSAIVLTGGDLCHD